MLITSVLVLGVNAGFRQVHILWSRVKNERPIYQKTRLLLDTMRAELGCLYFPTDNQQEQLIPFNLSSLPDGTTKLSFYTLNPSWESTAQTGYPAKINYEFITDPDLGQKVLLRNEQLCSGQKTIAELKKKVILTGLSEFNLLAADPDSDSWKDNLQCEQAPPKAVKIQLKWPKDNETKFVFQTIIKIPCQSQIVPQ
jgi:hypothetical protein